jgi:hypothetical protein
MCRYSYGNGRCANIDVNNYFCIGERSCNISDILKSKVLRKEPENNAWQAVPSNVWNIGTCFIKE